MQLVILYGPPASGKLTVAKVLAKETEFPLLHNHLVADFAHTLFEYGTDEYVALARQLRTSAIDAAMSANLKGLVMTFAYGVETREGKDDDAVLKAIVRQVTKKGGEVCFVRLTCEEKILLKRVNRPDRKKFQKLTKSKILKHILRTLNVTDAIPFAESLTLNTAEVTPAKAVKMIMGELEK